MVQYLYENSTEGCALRRYIVAICDAVLPIFTKDTEYPKDFLIDIVNYGRSFEARPWIYVCADNMKPFLVGSEQVRETFILSWTVSDVRVVGQCIHTSCGRLSFVEPRFCGYTSGINHNHRYSVGQCSAFRRLDCWIWRTWRYTRFRGVILEGFWRWYCSAEHSKDMATTTLLLVDAQNEQNMSNYENM
jgi:hypothetical protein